ncbi:hypothetical protein MTR67_051578 [Solanum verrucosum]|uniref:Uncharacterized protein n=1 Tax=Solanum verrucosum TaxID=315347 RepID=A0AAF0V3J8_SOLVR|nr:hypothetical protein MTR67_051578 [Solanum verrucosum]
MSMAAPCSSPITAPRAPLSPSSEKRLWAARKMPHQSLILSNRPEKVDS